MSVERPTGVTILAILSFLGGILFLLGGFGMMAASAYVESMKTVQGIPAGFLSPFFGILALVSIALGILYFILGWGLWTGKGWAWVLGVVLSVIGIIMGILSIKGGGILTIIINAIILYYLYRPHVKEFFSKA